MRKILTILVVTTMAALTLVASAPAAATSDTSEPTASAAAVPSSAEFEALELMNAERRARGLGALQMQPRLVDIAREWSAKLRSDGVLSHRTDLVAQVEARVTSSWRRLGENVGFAGSVRVLHDLFMDSAGHRANILGDYTTAGVGVVVEGSYTWITIVFMKADSAVATVSPVGPGGFCDTRGNVHADAIAELSALAVTKGKDGCFHPESNVTRGQMATFLKRALGLRSGHASFCDIEGNVHAGSIAMVAHAGIALGMPDGCFRPNQGVTRGQMAAFLDRAFELEDAESGFADTAGHHFSAEIASVAAAGVALGDGSGMYHPDGLVTRAQMASFLARALGTAA